MRSEALSHVRRQVVAPSRDNRRKSSGRRSERRRSAKCIEDASAKEVAAASVEPRMRIAHRRSSWRDLLPPVIYVALFALMGQLCWTVGSLLSSR